MLIRALMAATVVTLSAVPFPCSAKDAPEVEALLLAMQGTLTVSSQPHLTDGKLTGCTLVYDALYQDWTYRGGRFLKVCWQHWLHECQQQYRANLKVVVLEIDGSTPKLQMTPSPPSRAYIIDRNLATNLSSLVQGSTSDTPGALFSIFQFSPTFEMVLDALTTNELTVAFNSKGGGRTCN